MKLTIVFENSILPEEAERLEDKLARWLQLTGYTGRIEDDLTGNTTTFECVQPARVERRFNPAPKPQKGKK